MNKFVTATALALVLAGTLTSCARKEPMYTGSNSTDRISSGQVSRRYDQTTTGKARDFLDDARYSAGSNGKVYGGDGNTVTRDLTQGARDIVRGAGDAIGDVGRGVGDAVQDIGNGVGSAVNDMGKDMTGKY